MLRPSVFISSRLRLKRARHALKDILESSGFVADIYEQNLTPSTDPATYLRDIRDSDFVIFVFDEHYGTPRTKTGLSGTHEEWRIACSQRIPSHVFLKRASKEPRQQRFIESEIQPREISYQFFSDNEDLLAKVRGSLAKIAIAVARSTRFRDRMAPEVLLADVAEYEYRNFLSIHNLIDQAFEVDRAILGSRISNVWGCAFDCLAPVDTSRAYPFYDSHLQSRFADFVRALNCLSEFDADANDPDPRAARGGPALRFQGAEHTVTTLPIHRTSRRHDFRDKRANLLRQVERKWQGIRKLVNLRHDRYARSG